MGLENLTEIGFVTQKGGIDKCNRVTSAASFAPSADFNQCVIHICPKTTSQNTIHQSALTPPSLSGRLLRW